MSIFVDFHALQPVPPSCINRDDTGNPKTANFGGVQRARVSSQAWKRAIRDDFDRELPSIELGVRTKHVVQLIAHSIVDMAPEFADQADEYAKAILEASGVETTPSKRKGAESENGEDVTKYLIFISNAEVDKLAELAVSALKDGKSAADMKKGAKKDVAKAFHGKQAIDIALFGRMLADAPDLNTDASCQVAHAISVDELTPEYDYFTAVDDRAGDDNAGAAMIDTNAFNSATFYRYATVDATALEEQLSADGTNAAESAAKAVAAFAKAFLESMPTGKINSYANQTLPSTVLVAIRNTRPVNLVTAFQLPVRSDGKESVARIASERLLDEYQKFNEVYGDKPLQTYVMTVEQNIALGDDTQVVTLQGLERALQEAIPQALAQE